MNDVNKHHHEEKHNRILNERAITRVFPNAGNFIINLGFATFFETLILMCLVKSYCFETESDLQLAHARGEIDEVPWIEDHLFLLLQCGAAFGAFVSAAYV